MICWDFQHLRECKNRSLSQSTALVAKKIKKSKKRVDKTRHKLYTNQVGCDKYLKWDLSSAGRASALQAEGHRFEPCRPHIFRYGEIAQLARAHGSYPWCRGFESPSRYDIGREALFYSVSRFFCYRYMEPNIY